MSELFPRAYQKKNGERYTRGTSIKAFREITQEKIPYSVQSQLMEIFQKLQTPVTIGELWSLYINLNPNSGRSRNEIAKRVSELKEGRTGGALIRECGKKRCSLTHRECMTYELIRA